MQRWLLTQQKIIFDATFSIHGAPFIAPVYLWYGKKQNDVSIQIVFPSSGEPFGNLY